MNLFTILDALSRASRQHSENAGEIADAGGVADAPDPIQPDRAAGSFDGAPGKPLIRHDAFLRKLLLIARRA